MIDTHCHLLQRLDDGTRDVVEAVRLARQLVEGVHGVDDAPQLLTGEDRVL